MLSHVTKAVASGPHRNRARLKVDWAVYYAALAIAACTTVLSAVSLAACLLGFPLANATAVASLFMDPKGHLHARLQQTTASAGRLQPYSRHVDRLDPVEVGRTIDRAHLFGRHDRDEYRVAR